MKLTNLLSHLCNPYCCLHLGVVSYTDCGGWGESIRKLLHTTNSSAIARHMSASFVFVENSRVHLQNNTFMLRNVVENLCDIAYQRLCELIVLKEVCSFYVTQFL